MVDLSAYAFVPPPSASSSSSSPPKTERRPAHLVPSHVYMKLKASSKKIVDVHPIDNSEFANKNKEKRDYKSVNNLVPERKPPRHASQRNAASTTTTTRSRNRPRSRNRKRRSRPRYGDLPDVHWRAISMNHLRLHPNFDALPEHLTSLDTLEDARHFSQDTWQWDALHNGRCTTSQASAALGFLEEKSATALRIPKSWQRGGVGAYHRLSGTALRTLEEMRETLLVEPVEEEQQEEQQQQHSRVWARSISPNFCAKYLVRMTRAKIKERRVHATTSSTLSAKLSWGNAQEPTSLLTALNYFWKKDPQVRLQEVGMCGAGIQQTDSSLLVGASPDALIHHGDGTVEVLEVKNHCPFYTVRHHHNSNKRNNSDSKNNNKAFTLKSFPFSEPHLPPLYVPQLMMELLCTGCPSAIMVRQTATAGALVIRLHRDEEYIEELLYWLNRFQNDFVQPGVEPPPNFFWNEPRYQSFVQQTLNVTERCVEVLDTVPHRDIQRMQGYGSLFLDDDDDDDDHENNKQ